jgi:hypothetical protein
MVGGDLASGKKLSDLYRANCSKTEGTVIDYGTFCFNTYLLFFIPGSCISFQVIPGYSR